MNFLSLLDRISSVDAPSDAAPRRDLLRQLGQAGARAAVAALPLALGTPAQAAPANNSFDAVVLLLKLEDLLMDFYTKALAAPVLTNAAQAAVRLDFVRLQQQQQGHARFLRDTLSFAGVTPPPAPSFDFSGRRNNPANPVLFPNVLTDYTAFLQLAQQLEDASASIYLGQLAFLTTDKPLFDAVLRMQLVEARHASHVRTLRRSATPATAVKSWPSTADTAPTAAVLVPSTSSSGATPTSIYTFEANERQISTGTTVVPFPTILTGVNAVQSRAFAEAFDEPLPTLQATALLSIFG
ncbi:ferritin-like domain-containing protein [Hymenobacter sp. BT683]|uniref:Ferritin-like domain-containing protein n=1 Tax=Hymenobacter jeongseonensis TaxID=2791027 RepID=A0ABS0ILA5_9BACT|nr:ferritin-like domain-containing protein [Hymenobacter jeongseonensis]MBF9239136.1 ferritin-like domain-containing protein [Hymenobacter jeongseonensis]